jgi:hypothetical protein
MEACRTRLPWVRDGFRQRRIPRRGDEHEIVGRPNLRFSQPVQAQPVPGAGPGIVGRDRATRAPGAGRARKRDRRVAVGQTGQSFDIRSTRSRPAIERPIQHYLGVGVAQRRASSAPRAKVDSGTVSAPTRRGKPGDDPLCAVGEEDPDPSSLAHSSGQQRIGQRPRLRVGFGETEPFIIGDQEFAVRLRTSQRQQLGDASRQRPVCRSVRRGVGRGHQRTRTRMWD